MCNLPKEAYEEACFFFKSSGVLQRVNSANHNYT